MYGGNPAADYAKYLARVEKAVGEDLISVLGRADSTLVPQSVTGNQLGQIKDFGSLANSSQNRGLPIKDVNAGTKEQRAEAARVFAELAAKIVERTR